MLAICHGWCLHVDESPDWLFFRVERNGADAADCPPLAEEIWRMAESRNTFRLVLEWPWSELMRSYFVGQFVLLHKRCHLAGGTFRLCNLSPNNYGVLEVMRLVDRFPNYRDREAAVMGYRD